MCTMCKLLIFWILAFCPVNKATFYKTNATDFSSCKVHYSRQEKTYKVFYHFDENIQSQNNNDTLIDFHFSVLAISDAHILLAPSAVLSSNDPVYEIVIGAGGNTFSDIRRKMKSAVRASVRLKGVLSAVDIRSFWIHVYKDGTIDVGKDGEELAFISWRDMDLLPISVFSFSTWGDVEAKWLFDCPRGDRLSNSTEIEPKMTHLETLRKHLLSGYNRYVRPTYDHEQIMDISLKFQSSFLTLDERSSKLNIRGQLQLEWIDEKLLWPADEYGNITSIHVYHGEIWKPDIKIANAVNDDTSEIVGNPLLVVSNSGIVNWRPPINSFTFCDLSGLGDWPEDIHICSLDISFWGMDNRYYKIAFDDNATDIFSETHIHGWKLIEIIAISEYTSSTKDTIKLVEDPAFRFQFTLRRSSNLYSSFYSPFYVIAISMLLSFWASPFGPIKTILGCIQLILTTTMLISLAVAIPGQSQKLPFLVYLYSTTMVCSLISIFVTIIVINIARKQRQYNPPHAIVKLLNFNFVKVLLLLPNGEEPDWYGKLNRRSSLQTSQDKWYQLATALDRIVFLIMFCLNLSVFFVR